MSIERLPPCRLLLHDIRPIGTLSPQFGFFLYEAPIPGSRITVFLFRFIALCILKITEYEKYSFNNLYPDEYQQCRRHPCF